MTSKPKDQSPFTQAAIFVLLLLMLTPSPAREPGKIISQKKAHSPLTPRKGVSINWESAPGKPDNELLEAYRNSRYYRHEKNRPDSITVGQSTRNRIIIDTSSQKSKLYDPRFAIDGNSRSYWLSRKSHGAHWYQIRFGRKRLLDKIEIQAARLNGQATIKHYKIQFFYKGKWFTLKEHRFQAGASCRKRHSLGGIDASRLRVYVPARGTRQGYAALAEIKLFLGTSRILFLDPRLTNFALPVPRGVMPRKSYFYPNAPRKYRNGIHAGMDFIKWRPKKGAKVRFLSYDTPIVAAESGTIIRSDHDYRRLSRRKYKQNRKYWKKHHRTLVLRSFGGRQVWVDHGNGVITCYNHLSQIHPLVRKGRKIDKGELIGYAGNSGMWGEQKNSQYGTHLHFEVWVDGEFLGKGLPGPQVKEIYHWLFTRFRAKPAARPRQDKGHAPTYLPFLGGGKP
jgi:murein DD-endopeptidase MepM/ murein hydrolase activator NlpD